MKRPWSASRSAGIFLRACSANGQYLWVVGAGDQRVEHLASGHAEHLGRDGGQLDPLFLKVFSNVCSNSRPRSWIFAFR